MNLQDLFDQPPSDNKARSTVGRVCQRGCGRAPRPGAFNRLCWTCERLCCRCPQPRQPNSRMCNECHRLDMEAHRIGKKAEEHRRWSLIAERIDQLEAENREQAAELEKLREDLEVVQKIDILKIAQSAGRA